MDSELRYHLKRLSCDDLNKILDELWEELRTDPKMRAQALSLGLDAEVLDKYRRNELITIRREAAGFDFTPIVIALSPVAAQILKDTWVKILLPKIQHKRGKDAIKSAKRSG